MSQRLIFITGATGFIGAHVVHLALSAGHRVRLSVRKEPQISTLRELFSAHSAQLDFVVIPDFTSPDAFTTALQDATYIFHLASPMPGKGDDFETDYVKPTVDGTLALLSAAAHVASVKRAVIVSSLLALIPLDALSTGQFTATENTHPTLPSPLTFPSHPAAAAGQKYHASKILAHRATLSWLTSSKPNFTTITLHPSFVFGRTLTPGAALDGTNAMLWTSLTSPSPMIPMSAVDVRDVAAAHVAALSAEVAQGGVEEYILCAGEREGWTWERVAAFVRDKYRFVDVVVEGPFPAPPSVEAGKAERGLGCRWRSMEETVGSLMDQQSELRGKL